MMQDDDISEAEALIALPGGPGSGRVRYGAAMRLWAAGRIGGAEVEAFRVASPHDEAVPAEARPADAIDQLVEEVDLYLAGLRGPGIAEVRAGLALHRAPSVAGQARPNAVVGRWLAPALDALDRPGLAAIIGSAAPHLGWITYDAYPPDLIGPDFPRAHAFASLIGEGAPIPAPDFDLGLFLVAPGVFYRDHRHSAPELYAPLTGPHRWRFRPGAPLVAKPAHVPVWNPPQRPHATMTGAVPFLCLYAWTRDANALAEIIPAPDWAKIESQP
jgi:hypothetical protein